MFYRHDLRLVFDGATSNNLYAVDIVNHWDLGYQFFRDREGGKFDVPFIEDDILHPGKQLLALEGTIDIVSVSHVLHQWNFSGQLAAAVEINQLIRGPGSLIVGFQAGGLTTKIGKGPEDSKWEAQLQTPETWKEMWDEVGKVTNTKWRTEAKVRKWEEVGYDPKDTAYMGEDVQVLEFVVTREE